MYHCHTHFYLIGCPKKNKKIFDLIKGLHPFSNFTFEFSEDKTPDESIAAGADVIFADVSETVDILQMLITRKKATAELIVLTEKDKFHLITEYDEVIDDVWFIPMTDAEMVFRINKWHKAYKFGKDSWLSSQYLESVIDSTPNLIWFKDRNGIHHKVNNSFCRTVNKTKKQIQGRGHAYIWDVEKDDPACIESENAVMSSRKTHISEETIQTGAGKRLLTTYKSPLYDIDGSVMGTVGVAIDITKTRAYEQEIIKKNKTLETIFTTLDCGILCHSIDGSKIFSINAAALKILGYETQEELIESGFHTVAMSVMDEDKPKLRNCIQKLRRVNDSVSVEYRVQHKNGDIIHVMGNVKLLRENGELFYQRFLLDCTEQKLHEKKEKAENEKRHSDLIQALILDYGLVCYFDLNTEKSSILRMVPQSVKELSPIFGEGTELMKSLNDYAEKLVLPEDRESLIEGLSPENIKKELSGALTYHIDYRKLCGNDINYYQVKVVRIGNWENIHGIVIGFKCVDEEKKLEIKKKKELESALTEAKKANQAKSTFLSNMSHDIRTPMNAIVGFTTLAIDHIEQKSRVEEYLNKIMLSGNHLLSLINDVLDMSHIESNKMKLEAADCSLSMILHNLYSIMQSDLHTKKLSFAIDVIEVKHEKIHCDKLRLNQVLLNILSNAIKYTLDGGEILLSITEKPLAKNNISEYTFTVSDTGIGMSEEFLKHIFDPFEREKNTTMSKIQGTGLGMAITKKIVEMMNGTISVKSKSGVGTQVTFVLNFPYLQDDEDYVILQFKGSRALIVNKDKIFCERTAEMLEQVGMIADWTLSEIDAVIRTRQAQKDGEGFRIYFIDNSNETNGIHIAKKIKREINADDSIFILTAYDTAEIEEQALKAGIDGFCIKPVFLPEIRNCLLSVLNKDNAKSKSKRSIISNCRILLTEDNELNSEIAIAILTDAGYTVEVAENGKIAVDMVKNSKPGYYNIVLMDIQMPVMNGYEAATEIRKLENKELASVPILAMTANAFEEDKQEALKCGMNGHISKPIDVDNLFDVLETIL